MDQLAQFETGLKVVALLGSMLSALAGAFTVWVLMRRDVRDLKHQDRLQWVAIDKLKRGQARLVTKNALRRQEVKDVVHRIDEHGKRGFESAAKGYAEMLRETLDKVEKRVGA